MSTEAAAAASRSRPPPPAGGLRTLFSWLRRDERLHERSLSDESVSSAGSDRTTISFAFLPPARYRSATAAVSALPPQGPPTDSYRKRIKDRDLRRHLDREVTLHRKYQLPTGTELHYDAFSLPPVRRLNANHIDRQERARRATSECVQRRAAHVPGKRLAPQPPASSLRVVTPAATLRKSRKRRAPPPPSFQSGQRLLTIDEQVASNNSRTQLKAMSSKSTPEKRPFQVDRKSNAEKKENCHRDRSTKTKSEISDRGFFKSCKIFESKKRASTSESPPIRILPNISELDRQASEIYELCKLKASGESNNFKLATSSPSLHPWFCTKCLKKYNADVISCKVCFPEEKKDASKTKQTNILNGSLDRTEIAITGLQSSSKVNDNKQGVMRQNSSDNHEIEEKQKLKDILKEMKKSLPKHDITNKMDFDDNHKKSIVTPRTPTLQDSPRRARDEATLRIGFTNVIKANVQTQADPSSNVKDDRPKIDHKINLKIDKKMLETAVVTQTTVITHLPVKSMLADKSKENHMITGSFQLMSSMPNDSVQRVNETNTTSKDAKIISEILSVTNSPRPNESSNSKDAKEKPSQSFQIAPGNSQSNNDRKYEHSSILKLLNTQSMLDNSKLADVKNSEPKSDPKKSSNIQTLAQDNLQILQTEPNKQSSSKENNTEPIPQTSTNTSLLKDFLKKTSVPQKTVTTVFMSSVSPAICIKPLNESTSTLLPSSHQNVEKQPPKTVLSTPLFLNTDNRRRDLVNQLERAIAQGDEHSAAEAAMGLAKLRVPCSVLSAPSMPQTSVLSKPLTITGLINSLTDVPSSSHATNHNKTKKSVDSETLVTSSTQIENNANKASNKSNSSLDNNMDNQKKDILNTTTTLANSSEPSTSSLKSTVKIEESASSSSNIPENESALQVVEVMVEDREVERGPVRVLVPRNATLGELRRRAEDSLGIPTRLQRWIIGKTLCNDEEMQLRSLAGPRFDARFYLCLVESETNKEENATASETTTLDNGSGDDSKGSGKDVYKELMELERCALVPTGESMECGICLERCERGAGAVLRECLHAFCRECLAMAVRHCDEPTVACPATGCGAQLQEREIRALVSAPDYERWLARGLAAAESGARHAFHCRTADCVGWALCEPGVLHFHCPVCGHVNCVPCQAIHEGETCDKHRTRARRQTIVETSGEITRDADEGTRALLDSLVSRGEALECPECNAIITKKWGCDWVKCSACKTEICWVTRGRRWGPAGRGDTTAGCRCGVDGRRCHPSCSYCH